MQASYQAMTDTLLKKGKTPKEIKSTVALRRKYWALVEKALLRGEVRKAVEGIVAIASKDVRRARKFYTGNARRTKLWNKSTTHD